MRRLILPEVRDESAPLAGNIYPELRHPSSSVQFDMKEVAASCNTVIEHVLLYEPPSSES